VLIFNKNYYMGYFMDWGHFSFTKFYR